MFTDKIPINLILAAVILRIIFFFSFLVWNHLFAWVITLLPGSGSAAGVVISVAMKSFTAICLCRIFGA